MEKQRYTKILKKKTELAFSRDATRIGGCMSGRRKHFYDLVKNLFADYGILMSDTGWNFIFENTYILIKSTFPKSKSIKKDKDETQKYSYENENRFRRKSIGGITTKYFYFERTKNILDNYDTHMTPWGFDFIFENTYTLVKFTFPKAITIGENPIDFTLFVSDCIAKAIMDLKNENINQEVIDLCNNPIIFTLFLCKQISKKLETVNLRSLESFQSKEKDNIQKSIYGGVDEFIEPKLEIVNYFEKQLKS